MNRPEPTRLVSLLAAAYFCGIFACQHADPKASPASASAPPAPVSPAAAPVPSAAPSALTPLAADVVAPVASVEAPAAPAGSVLAAAAAPAAPIRSVLVLGDSLTDEKGGGGGFVKLLRQRCPSATFDNRAKGGFMLNQMRKRLETEVLPEGGRYSHAIVFGGVNDLYSDQTAKRSLTRIEADLTKIYDDLRQRGVQVVAITVTPWGGFTRWYSEERGRNTRTLNGWIIEQASQRRVAAALDAYPLLSCGDPEQLCPELALPHKDGLHFGKLGQEKLAKALLDGPFRSCGAQ